jgi:hypothetical protein
MATDGLITKTRIHTCKRITFTIYYERDPFSNIIILFPSCPGPFGSGFFYTQKPPVGGKCISSTHERRFNHADQ